MTHDRSKFTWIPAFRICVRCLLVAMTWIGSGAAAAADFFVGVGAGPDRGRVDCVASFACDSSGTASKLFAGYQINNEVELRATYFDAGHFKGGDTTPLGTEFGGTFKVSGLSLAGGYRWQFASSWSLSGRVGLGVARTHFDYANTVFGSANKTTTQPLLGLGLAYAMTPNVRLGLDYDVTRFKVHTTRGPLQMLGLAVQYSF